MSTDVNTVLEQESKTMTPEEFVQMMQNSAQETPADYFIRNMETGKVELHFDKATYDALDDVKKREIKSNYLWGRHSGCWISRAKEPNWSYAIRVAESLGLFDAGKTGERMSFADKMALKAERAEHRADRYEVRAESHEKKGDALQAPINHMHGDIAFFTQPNISTSAGRAFTKRREKMWQSFEQGFEEFNKSAYWADRAKTARNTAQQKELQDKAFVMRRIKERESDIRKLRRNVDELEKQIEIVDASAAKGEIPKDDHGWVIESTYEEIEKRIDYWLDRLEVKLDELGFYQDCLDALGGVAFSRENIKPGNVVKLKRWGNVTVVSTGPVNFVYEHTGSNLTYADGTFMKGQAAYAEIVELVSTGEAAEEEHPFRVGDEFTCPRWNRSLGRYGEFEDVTFTIIRATSKSVTLQTGDEKPVVRKPAKSLASKNWFVRVTDSYRGTWFKPIET